MKPSDSLSYVPLIIWPFSLRKKKAKVI